MRQLIVLGVAAAAMLTLAAGEARSEDREVRFYGVGPRVGLSIKPNQFVFGGHADFGDLFPKTTLLAPVVEIGLGDNQTKTSIGADLLFRFTDQWDKWRPYLGAEIALMLTSYDSRDQTDADLGLSGVFGVGKLIGDDNRFATEVKFGIVDAPDVKLAVLWTFGH